MGRERESGRGRALWSLDTKPVGPGPHSYDLFYFLMILITSLEAQSPHMTTLGVTVSTYEIGEHAHQSITCDI